MSWPRPTSTMLVDQVLARYRPRRANRVSSSPSACTAPTRSVSASSSAEPQRRVDGVPRAAQFRRDVCERAAPARLTGRPTRRATRQQRPRRRDLLCLLADIARLAALISAAPSALVPHQRRGPAQRREVHQLHPPLAVGPQRPATAPAQRPRRPAPDMNPQRRALFVFNAEHLHVSESHDQLAHASRVIFHRDPPASVVFDNTDSGGSLAFNHGCPQPPLRSNSRRAALAVVSPPPWRASSPHGAPKHLRMDNDPEFTASALRDWCRNSGTHTAYIEPGSRWESPFAEPLNWRLRDECLNIEDFRQHRRGQGRPQGLAPRSQRLLDPPIPRRAHLPLQVASDLACVFGHNSTGDSL